MWKQIRYAPMLSRCDYHIVMGMGDSGRFFVIYALIILYAAAFALAFFKFPKKDLNM